MKNTIIDNGNGTSTIIIDSPKNGVKHAIIDTAYVTLVADHRWAVVNLAGRHYAVTQLRKTNGKFRPVYLHQMINGTPPGLMTDHIDNDPLNNCASNLRTVTNQQNQFNTSKCKGYSCMASGKFRAQIQLNNKYIHIGMYDNREDARAAYLAVKAILHVIQ